MGSFISSLAKLDPIQRFAGKNSFIAKQDSYDPLMKNTDAGQAYAGRHNVGSTPTPYAGVTPTLQDANNGYIQASARAANMNRPVGSQSQFQMGTVY
jgi:hypothetical protein